MRDFWQNYLQSVASLPPSTSGENITLSEPTAGYQAIEASNSIIPLSQLAFVVVQGPDTTQFLQGQFTCQLPQSPTSNMLLGAHCCTKGKVQNFFRMLHCTWLDQNGYLLFFHISTLEETLKRLKKYSLFSKVQIIDKSSELAAFVLYGDETNTLVKQAFSINDDLNINDSIQIDDQSVLVRLRGDKPRYLCLAPQSHIANLWENCQNYFKTNNSYFWDLLEIRAGIPSIHQSTVGKFFPHYLNLPTLNAVSFEKGCYLGQEVIARMQYRSKINRHLHRALLEGYKQLPQPGEEVIFSSDTTPQEVGTVVSVAQTIPNSCELLIILKDDYRTFENLSLKSNDGVKLHHLNLTYT